MLKKLTKVLSLLLILCMMVSMFPVVALADEGAVEPAVTETPEETTPVDTPVPVESPVPSEMPAVEESPAPSETPADSTPVEDVPAADGSADFALPKDNAADEEEEKELTPEDIYALIPALYAGSSSGDAFYKIVHVDCGRKYFSPENIKKIIDNAAAAGFNQVELYLSDNQGFRFALDDMNVTTSTGNTYDLTPALGDGYSDGSKYPDGSGKYLTQSEMTDIISYAAGKGINIVPCINVPGHMGAILEEFTQFKYSGSNSSIDLENAEAVAFALAITEKYATYFESQGVKYYNLGADEYANDLSTMGFQGLYTSGKYQKFVDFLNSAARIVINHGMTPRAFNDGIYYNEDNTYSINSAIQVCYWSCGWNGYDLASAQYLVNQGMKVINTHGDYYWVLGNTGWQCSADKASTFNYTSFQYRTGTTGNGTISDPAGAMFCIWCDVGNANGTDGGTAVVSATADVIAAFGAALPPSESGGSSGETGSETGGGSGNTGDVEVTDNKTITVTVGQTATDTISGHNFAGTYTTENPSIATVEVTGTDATEATTTYTQASVTCNKLISSNEDTWTAVSGYYYKADDGNYYPVYAMRSSSRKLFQGTTYTYTWGYSTSSTDNVTRIGTQSTKDTNTTPNITVYTKSGTDGTPASTIVTFTGVTVGTTYVTVGNTRYEIIVQDKAPDNAITSGTLSIDYRITNSTVYTSKSTTSASSATISSSDAASDEGIAIVSVVPETAYSNYDGWIELHYWQAMRLDSGHNQSGSASGADQTTEGTTFTHVRYHNSAWQYLTSDGVWHYFQTGDQAVAYYMRHTKITTEITTAMKDWGYSTSSNTPDTSSGQGQVALTVAVVYPDGTVSPAESNMYANSTTIFNFSANWQSSGKARDIGLIVPLNNSDYTISKITVTDGTRTDNTTSNIWTSSATIEWDKVTNEAGSEWYNETTYWDESDGGTPMINGATQDIRWSAKNTAKLVLIYLKPVHYDTNLTVKWVNDSASGALISTMEVAVSSDGTPITFYNGLKQTSALPTEGVGGTFTLDDDAYVTNSSNVNQTFNKNISTVPDVADVYKTGLFYYVGADLSADGMTLTLHYNIDSSKLSRQYVVDFGLPVNVPLSDLIENSGSVTKVEITGGDATVNADNSITYQPSAVMTGIATVGVKLTFSDSTTQTVRIGFVPATTVYYEEGFASYTGNWTKGSTGSEAQTAQVAGQSSDAYGYDEKYARESTGASNGTEAVSSAIGDDAVFTFTGTGVDIYANCTTTTGGVSILIRDSSRAIVKLLQVNTATGEAGSATAGQDVDSYSLPIASVTGLAHDTYTVTIRHSKVSAEGTESVVRLDGFRVYGTLATEPEFYVKDAEDKPVFIELRDKVLAAQTVKVGEGESQYASDIAASTMAQVYATNQSTEGAIVISGNTSYTSEDVQDLLDNGPKNEIFLRQNESLVFNVKTDREVQIGLKAVNSAVTCTVNGQTKNISSSTDMFYTVFSKGTASSGQTITIQNTGSGILSITKLKICDDPGAALGELTEEDLIPALVSLGYELEPEEPEVQYADAVLTVEVNGQTTVLTKNGVVGESATFTAAEIEAAAQGLVPDGYELKDQAADVTVAYGGSSTVSLSAEAIPTEPEQPEEPEKPAEPQQPEKPDKPANIISAVIRLIDRIFGSLKGFFR